MQARVRPMNDGDKSPKMATELRDEKWLTEAYSIIEKKAEIQTVVTELRDFLNIDHLVYFTSKLGGSPSADPYIRLTLSLIHIYPPLKFGAPT